MREAGGRGGDPHRRTHLKNARFSLRRRKKAKGVPPPPARGKSGGINVTHDIVRERDAISPGHRRQEARRARDIYEKVTRD